MRYPIPVPQVQNDAVKPSLQYYPKRGSSEGKIKTKIIGSKRVDKAFDDMMKAIFSIGEGMANIPHVKVTRTFK